MSPLPSHAATTSSISCAVATARLGCLPSARRSSARTTSRRCARPAWDWSTSAWDVARAEIAADPWAEITPHLLRNRSSFANSYAQSRDGRRSSMKPATTSRRGSCRRRRTARPLLWTLDALRRDRGVERVEDGGLRPSTATTSRSRAPRPRGDAGCGRRTARSSTTPLFPQWWPTEVDQRASVRTEDRIRAEMQTPLHPLPGHASPVPIRWWTAAASRRTRLIQAAAKKRVGRTSSTTSTRNRSGSAGTE